MLNLKKYLKTLAVELHEIKATRKQDKRPKDAQGIDVPLWAIEGKIFQLKRLARYHHVAYCMLRGREYAKIECPAENNQINMDEVNKIMDLHREEIKNETPILDIAA
jgi:hypothetical protein